jgi:hypothetical protein
VNEVKKTMLFVEVKRNAKKIDLKVLEGKAMKLMVKYKLYDFEFLGFSLGDVK